MTTARSLSIVARTGQWRPTRGTMREMGSSDSDHPRTGRHPCRPCRQGTLAALLVLVTAGLAVPETTVHEEAPCERPLNLPLPEEGAIKDPVFAVLVGLLVQNKTGCLGPEEIQKQLGPRIQMTHLPYQLLRRIERTRTPGGEANDRIEFDCDLDLPIPYRIIFLHPGRIRGPAFLDMREAFQSEETIRFEADGVDRTIELRDVTVFALTNGVILIDFDGWLDHLTGSLLDDTVISGLAVFRYDGRWWGMGLGHNTDGDRRFGVFDLTRDEVIVRATHDLRRIAHHMRQRIEALPPASPPSAPASAPSVQ